MKSANVHETFVTTMKTLIFAWVADFSLGSSEKSGGRWFDRCYAPQKPKMS